MSVPESGGRSVTSYRNTFRTYRSYARAWRILVTRDDTPRPEDEELADAAFQVEELAPLIAEEIGRREPIDIFIPSIDHFLYRAWATESLMQATIERADWEMAPMAAPWMAIQAYFAVFSATQALASVVCDGYPDLSSHAWVRSVYHDLWRGLDVAPWSVAVSPQPAAKMGAVSFTGAPAEADPDRTHPWGDWTRYDAWDIALKSLSTTLESDLKVRFGKARARGKNADGTKGLKTLPRSKRQSIRETTHPYTVLDFLHRLRVRANYGDAGVYEFGSESPLDVQEFMVDLTRITSATLLATELRLASHAASGMMQELADKWLRRDKSRIGSPLMARVNYLGLTRCVSRGWDSREASEERRDLQRRAAGRDSYALTRLGLFHYHDGDMEAALSALERASEMGNPEARYALGILARFRGDLGEARHWWMAAAEKGDVESMEKLANTQYLVPDEVDTPNWHERWREASQAREHDRVSPVDLYDLVDENAE